MWVYRHSKVCLKNVTVKKNAEDFYVHVEDIYDDDLVKKNIIYNPWNQKKSFSVLIKGF